jgi:hypothetical protein
MRMRSRAELYEKSVQFGQELQRCSQELSKRRPARGGETLIHTGVPVVLWATYLASSY